MAKGDLSPAFRGPQASPICDDAPQLRGKEEGTMPRFLPSSGPRSPPRSGSLRQYRHSRWVGLGALLVLGSRPSLASTHWSAALLKVCRVDRGIHRRVARLTEVHAACRDPEDSAPRVLGVSDCA